ncbi:MAG TPA: nuclear transport factor 2 family protein [Solirubrobacterales bacterium]|nr:nuclear transport factor 2 family protein [Solirubrobacterales bacterium]
MGPVTADAFFERYFSALNRRDPALIPDLYTTDIEFRDDGWPEVIYGHAGMTQFLSALWRALPDCTFDLVEGPYWSEDGRSAGLRLRLSGTLRGSFDPPGFAPTNTMVSTEVAAFYEVDGELVRRARVIANMNDVGTQIGAAPPPGSAGERLAVVLQRLKARSMRRRASS